ncbi:MAG: DUF5916 domain-containing protein [Gemmatimonadales bacterium]
MKINPLKMVVLLCLICASPVAAQGPRTPARAGDGGGPDGDIPRHITAVRVRGSAPQIDGRLDDPAWSLAPAITRFLQRNPVEGAVPSESTAVKFLYTDRSLFVAFRGYDSEPNKVYGRLVRRDQRTSADGFSLFIDSFHDRRSAFEFSFNPSGSRRDVFIYDDGRGRDDTWDPVYDWATKVDSLGWTVELRIPFSQLRFSPRDSVVFGVRLRRQINRRNEDASWPFFPRDQAGEVSNYATLVGLNGLPTPRRIEILPYTAGTAQFDPTEAGNPFATGHKSTMRAGGDLKVGLGSGMTLELTANPDFGQVEADAAEVNLSAFETFFPEKRPFFVEGTNLFKFSLTPAARGRFGFSRGGREGLVFTRRIGRPPQVSPNAAGGYAERIRQTTILSAAKLSGQLSGGWAVGLLQAVTGKEKSAIVDSLGVHGTSAVEPLTSYSALRIQRNADRGRAAYGLIATSTVRRLDDVQFNKMHERAFSGGSDLNLRFARDRYEIGAALMGSRVEGSADAITRTQRSSARYYQRPDQDYITLDSSRTSLDGFAGNVRVAKVVGFLTWEARYATRSPGFEVNDLGFLRQADVHEQRTQANLRWLEPGKVFRRFSWRVQEDARFTYGGERTETNLQTRIDADFLNYWNMNINVQRRLPSLSTRLLRGGPALEEPGRWQGSWRGRTDFRRRVSGDVGVTYTTEDESSANTWRVDGGLRLRPPGGFSLTIDADATWSTADRQFVSTASALDSTFYVFGRLDRKEFSITMRGGLALTPRLSVELYAQPFVSAGTYQTIKLVDDPRAHDYAARFDILGTDRLNRPGGGAKVEVDADRDGQVDFTFGEPDFRVVSLRTNLVLRWEFNPGSTLFLVWQQDRRERVSDGSFRLGGSLGNAFSARGTHVLAMKIAYWLGR